jgi:hypothetical protein
MTPEQTQAEETETDRARTREALIFARKALEPFVCHCAPNRCQNKSCTTGRALTAVERINALLERGTPEGDLREADYE